MTLLHMLVDRFESVPIYLAYRLVWLLAKTGNQTGLDVYYAMWDAHLDLPLLEKNT